MLGRARTTRSTSFTEDGVEDLTGTSYGDRSAYSLLSLLFHVDTTNHVFHSDHVFPRAQVTAAKMVRACLGDPDRKYISDGINWLSNLQLLPGRENEKNRRCLCVNGWRWTPPRMIATETATRESRSWEIGSPCRKTSVVFAISVMRAGGQSCSDSKGYCADRHSKNSGSLQKGRGRLAQAALKSFLLSFGRLWSTSAGSDTRRASTAPLPTPNDYCLTQKHIHADGIRHRTGTENMGLIGQ